MQLSKQYRQLRQATALTLLYVITACGNSAGSGTDTGGNNSGTTGSAYEVVTVTKPEDFKHYADLYKSLYDGCVGMAKIRNLPVKPFVNIPADFVIDKDTYISDGKNYAHTTVSYNNKMGNPEDGCTSSIAKSETLRAVNNGNSYHIDVLENGERVSMPVGAMFSGSEESTAIYTDAKVVNGIPLKCIDSAVTQTVGQVCMIKSQGSTKFIDYDGKYLAGYVRTTLTKDLPGGVMITEPVSVKANPVIDPNVFHIK